MQTRFHNEGPPHLRRIRNRLLPSEGFLRHQPRIQTEPTSLHPNRRAQEVQVGSPEHKVWRLRPIRPLHVLRLTQCRSPVRSAGSEHCFDRRRQANAANAKIVFGSPASESQNNSLRQSQFIAKALRIALQRAITTQHCHIVQWLLFRLKPGVPIPPAERKPTRDS